MGRKHEVCDVKALRGLYRYLRYDRHVTTAVAGTAYVLWQRLHGERPTTFLVSSTGECWRHDRASLIAQYRLLLLDHGFPVGFVAQWDRTDH